MPRLVGGWLGGFPCDGVAVNFPLHQGAADRTKARYNISKNNGRGIWADPDCLGFVARKKSFGCGHGLDWDGGESSVWGTDDLRGADDDFQVFQTVIHDEGIVALGVPSTRTSGIAQIKKEGYKILRAAGYLERVDRIADRVAPDGLAGLWPQRQRVILGEVFLSHFFGNGVPRAVR